ncbi:atp-dependent clp protease [Diplodia corticola]|uniref:Atp-dependent clp protease n=1 Tax=Diplodia corticola TaxID=236234 RepID=A0A1J9QSU6_9PEZI|nr:atp-dependent clp protease [Diplodia corticola]OJD31520.1 atp-dependent clp protease [Diplodia corticola]
MTLAAGFTITISPQARSSYLALYSISRAFATSATQCSSNHYSRSDFSGQGFTGIYEPGQPTGGPLGGASIVGAPRVTPKALKHHLDQFVVGQERAKKVLSVAVYNHYQRIQELERLDEEEQEHLAQQARREMVHRHPVEDEFPGQQRTINVWDAETQYPPDPSAPPPRATPAFGAEPIVDNSPMTIEKSNILLLGPSGVGKTLMAKTLARVLEVPFSMSDCTPFTQAGYIGEDAEVCVQRLLAAANYDVAAAERGIIVLDEIDKIATAKVSHGKDVSGEGVQQALLKIIEGTTLQVQAKPERGGNAGRGPSSNASGYTYTPGGGSGGPGGGGMNMGHPPSPKGEVFNVRTDNILFICTGAFIGLHKVILDRISKGSIGFGAPVRASNPEALPSDTRLQGDEALFRKHVPFYTPESATAASPQASLNTLDLVEPADLQKYGMIPELVGRIPISCALSSLDEEALVRVLTEPRNSLVKQYEQLFSLSGIELKFTSPALREMAKQASKMATGARGLRTVMERLLGEAQYECPGSTTKHVLVTRDAAQRKKPLTYVSRGQQQRFQALLDQEEEEWQREISGKQAEVEHQQRVSSFEQYRNAEAGYA